LGLKNGSSASTVAFGILSDELDAGDPADGAESFNEFNASTNIIEEAPPMKLPTRINLAPKKTGRIKAYRKFPYESFATNENRSDHLSFVPLTSSSSSLSITGLLI